MDFFNYTLFTLWGYSLTIPELVGVLTGLAAVGFAAKASAVNFLFGLINAVVYFFIYYRFHLYSAMLLQVVYFSFSVYGYYFWKNPKKGQADASDEQKITRLNRKEIVFWIAGILAGGLLWGWGIVSLQRVFPAYFAPPSYPYLDAVLTIASVAAQYLLSKKVFENWFIWLVADTVSVILYASMGMAFTSVLFGVYTLIALKAVFTWKKLYEKYE